MSHTQKVKVTGLLILTVITIGAFAFTPLSSLWMHLSNTAARAASSLPYHEFADGPYTVKGNMIAGADGKQYLFHGVGRDSLEFDCNGDGFLDSTHLAFMGPGTSGPGGTYWYANTVRLNVSEGFWLHGDATQQNCTPANYQALVKNTINALTALKLNVILDLMWTDAGGQNKGSGAGYELPDSDSIAFWSQAANVYKSYTNVLFELYNEPHPPTFACWAAPTCAITNDTTAGGNVSYTGVSIQSLVNAVRGAGANNLALVAGINWGFDLSQLSTYPISGSNIVYDSHPYPYAGKNTTAEWDAAFGYLTSTKPVISAEFGEYDGQSNFETMAVNYFDQHMIGWTAWAWYSTGSSGTQATGYPQLVSNYNGTPLANMGTYIYQQLLNYAGVTGGGPPPPSPTPTLPPVSGPVSKVWYFAEGRTGAGFDEFLTLGNPTSSNCQVTISYMTQPDSGPGTTKTISLAVNAATRVTRWVDSDLGTTRAGPGISVAATVSVDTTATPGCTGIVAERPMYFNARLQGTNSGSDVVGVTHTNTTFYFADLASGNQVGGGFYSSYLPILNPGTTTANVTATYYANGAKVGTQTLAVAANSRGTIFPSQAAPALPAHVSVVLTSSAPIVSERPTYFSSINGGNAGVVSGAADVIGVQQLSTDWLFAEGYTGGRFQENFVLANLDPAAKAATVTITLEYNGGVSKPFTVTVNPLSQVIWNVNANSVGAGASQSVSAEITSTGAQIVAEREMFFGYSHQGNGRSMGATGGTDVLGQIGPAAKTDYSFAEGYTNGGYDEWLTIQNPTATTETVTVTVSNAVGTVYTYAVQVVGHSRYTVDMVAIVMQHLFHAGNGYNGYEISMAVQSSSPFVIERPMYWNASGTTGGSDVIGYTGG
jgi:hypothetical protein